MAQAVYEAPAPGVSSFEDFIQTQEACKPHNGTPQFIQAEAGQKTNWATHERVGPLNVIETAHSEMRSDQVSGCGPDARQSQQHCRPPALP